MGTNYYHHAKPPCDKCGHEAEPRHIGKSSFGWRFSLHVYPEEGINDLPDWMRLWQDGYILDEYGEIVPIAEMMSVITERSAPNGLLNHAVDGRHCIGNGKGTWDLIVGNFS